MPTSCHFQDCEALLFVLTTCKQRYIKYSGFTFFYLCLIFSPRELSTGGAKKNINKQTNKPTNHDMYCFLNVPTVRDDNKRIVVVSFCCGYFIYHGRI